MSEKHTTQSDEQIVQQHYRSLEQECPARELDEKILAAAHAALEKEAEPGKVSPLLKPRRAWYVPVSYAAVIVLSLGVVLRLLLEPEAMDPEISPMTEPTQLMDEVQQDAMRPATDAAGQRLAPAPRAERIMAEQKLLKKQAVEKRRQAARSPGEPEAVPSRAAPGPAIMQFMASPKPEEMEMEALSASGKESSIAPAQSVVGSSSPLSCEDWVLKMQALLEAQHYQRLGDSLRAFRKLYPAYALPEKLAAWEKQNIPLLDD